jgi:hypothetical protein
VHALRPSTDGVGMTDLVRTIRAPSLTGFCESILPAVNDAQLGCDGSLLRAIPPAPKSARRSWGRPYKQKPGGPRRWPFSRPEGGGPPRGERAGGRVRGRRRRGSTICAASSAGAWRRSSAWTRPSSSAGFSICSPRGECGHAIKVGYWSWLPLKTIAAACPGGTRSPRALPVRDGTGHLPAERPVAPRGPLPPMSEHALGTRSPC